MSTPKLTAKYHAARRALALQPELLAALRDARRIVHEYHTGDDSELGCRAADCEARIDAAIAKAEGDTRTPPQRAHDAASPGVCFCDACISERDSADRGERDAIAKAVHS